MLRVDYKNPMEKVYQYEYAIFMIISDMFSEVTYSSRCFDMLKICYMELVKLNDSGNPSYKRQYEIDDECMDMVKRDVIGRIDTGALNGQSAYVRVRMLPDRFHVFTFECSGGSNFAIRLKGRGHKSTIQVKNNITIR